MRLDLDRHDFKELTLGGVMIEMLVSFGEGSSAMERRVSKPSSAVSFCIGNKSLPLFDAIFYPLLGAPE